ncbi:hypothetical protein Aab01nite_72780 [Paractinoplanes abujensis]|nr:hypothetical protein Aab01nite_72780 [Actinoplanes abujensis]
MTTPVVFSDAGGSLDRVPRAELTATTTTTTGKTIRFRTRSATAATTPSTATVMGKTDAVMQFPEPRRVACLAFADADSTWL